MTYAAFGDYICSIINHIDLEYENGELFGDLTELEKYEIRDMLFNHYMNNDPVGNATNDIISYIRESRLNG